MQKEKTITNFNNFATGKNSFALSCPKKPSQRLKRLVFL
jgi:hypothetical protein